MNSYQDLHDLCIAKSFSVATSESCTAGLIASNIASISGASAFLKGGVIAYQNDIKINILGVSKSLLDENKEVSSEVVKQMAIGARNKFLADFAIATTGYAGPTGGTDLNPIGTVFIGISSFKKTVSKRFVFLGNRESVISQAINEGLNFFVQELKSY